MSNLTWYPGAALPPSAEYPWRATASGSFDKYTAIGACTKTGGRCTQTAGRCASLGPLYNVADHAPLPSNCCGGGFYSPTIASQANLPFGAGPRPCAPVRGCLDPTAVSYDKLAQTHDQCMCVYQKPKVCVRGGYELPEEPECNACPGADDAAVNPVSRIYDAARNPTGPAHAMTVAAH